MRTHLITMHSDFKWKCQTCFALFNNHSQKHKCTSRYPKLIVCKIRDGVSKVGSIVDGQYNDFLDRNRRHIVSVNDEEKENMDEKKEKGKVGRGDKEEKKKDEQRKDKEKLEEEKMGKEKEKLEELRRIKKKLDEELDEQRKENERLEAQKKERERLEEEKKEKERLEGEKMEKERLEEETREKERLEEEKRREQEKVESLKRKLDFEEEGDSKKGRQDVIGEVSDSSSDDGSDENSMKDGQVENRLEEVESVVSEEEPYEDLEDEIELIAEEVEVRSVRSETVFESEKPWKLIPLQTQEEDVRKVVKRQSRVSILVGGTNYKTSFETIALSTTLKDVVDAAELLQDIAFVDRDGGLFNYVLKFLRNEGKLHLESLPSSIPTLRDLQDEANYFCLPKLFSLCESKILFVKSTKCEKHLCKCLL